MIAHTTSGNEKGMIPVTLSARAMIAVAALTASTSLFAATSAYTLQTGVGYDDVLDDADSFYYLTGAAALTVPVSSKSLVDLKAEVSTYEYDDSEDVSSDEIFLFSSFGYTPWSGFRAPTFTAALSYLEEFVDNDDYDASTFTLILTGAFRIDDRTRFLGGIKAGDRDAETDIESSPTGYFLTLDLRYSPQMLYYTTLGADDGAFTVRSYCSGAYYGDPNEGMMPGYGYNRNMEDPFSGDCDSTYATLGGNYAFNASNTLDFAASYYDYDTPVGSLNGVIYTIDYFYRF